MSDQDFYKRTAPSSERNREPILDVLKDVVPESGLVLEIACGTGQHAVYFAEAFPQITWVPSDVDQEILLSAAAWRTDSGLENIAQPIFIDVTSENWPIAAANMVYSANMIHIAPWEVCIGLLDGAARILPEGGILFMYGPYKVGGKHTAPSNEEFDRSLRSRDPSWGIRNLDDVALEARRRGLHLIKTVNMPANNFSVIYRKTAMVEG